MHGPEPLSGATVRSEQRGPVTIVTIDRPHVRNAYDPQTLRELAGVLNRCIADGCRAAVLTGAGTVSFSSGMDLKAMSVEPPGVVSEAVAMYRAALTRDDRVPLIAAVNGAATGGGFELVLRCDLAIASELATFRLPEVQKGIVPGGGGTLLPNRLPLAVALEIGMLGDAITADRAFELGLVNRVVAASDLVDTAVRFGERLAQNGPRAVVRIRNLMRTTAMEGAKVALALTEQSHRDTDLAAERAEGVEAFLAKRPPRW